LLVSLTINYGGGRPNVSRQQADAPIKYETAAGVFKIEPNFGDNALSRRSFADGLFIRRLAANFTSGE